MCILPEVEVIREIDDVAVELGELAVVILLIVLGLGVYVAEGSIVVTMVAADKLKTCEGSEQLQPPSP